MRKNKQNRKYKNTGPMPYAKEKAGLYPEPEVNALRNLH